MEIFKKDQKSSISYAENSGVLFGTKQLSQSISIVIMFLFFAFVAGYYWGKKNSVSEFKDNFEQEIVSDKVSYSLVINTEANMNTENKNN